MSLEQVPSETIYQGEDKNLIIRLSDQNSGDPFDLTGASEILVIFPKTDGTCLEKKLSLSQITVINAGGGKFNVRLNAADTNLMLIGNQVSIEVRVTISGFLTIIQIPNAISVLASLFPNC